MKGTCPYCGSNLCPLRISDFKKSKKNNMEMNKFLAAEKLANELRAIKIHLVQILELSTGTEEFKNQYTQTVKIKICGTIYNEDGEKAAADYEILSEVWDPQSFLREYTDKIEKKIEDLTAQLKAL